VIGRESEVVEHQFRRNDVALISGHASFVDDHRVQVCAGQSSRLLTAENVLIAVGTIPTAPPEVEPDRRTVVVSDGIMDLKGLPRSLTVIGAGVIGIEYASIFATLGLEVTVIDKRERPLEFLDHEIVDELIHQMRSRGVTFRLGEAVERLEIVEDAPRRAGIWLESGKRLIADLVFFSVGRMGATESLNLPAAGLSADSRGRLQVDRQFRTAVPHIFAAGDVIGYPSLAATSSEQGR
jgi:NAD(P) transhydrogenase